MSKAIFRHNVVIIIYKVFASCIVRRINVPADFDTKRKAFSGSKAPKKA